jgi:hypothetical protein
MTVLEHVPDERLAELSERARQVHVGRLLLGLVAALLIGFGRALGGVVNGVVWAFLAVREGYRDARSPERTPRRSGGAG